MKNLTILFISSLTRFSKHRLLRSDRVSWTSMRKKVGEFQDVVVFHECYGHA